MVNIEKIARQGDVVLERISKLPEGLVAAKRDRIGRVTLAFGEHSGHSHSIRDKGVCAFRMASTADDDPTGVSGGVDYIEVGGSGAALNHEYESGAMAEHHPINLAPGLYRVHLQREYVAPAVERRVVD